MNDISLAASATLRPLELPARADAGPTPALRAYAELRNVTLLETNGNDDDALSAAELLPALYSNDDRERLQWLIELDTPPIGCVALDILRDDGGQTAMFSGALVRDVWGRGIGTAAYQHLEAVARASGVRKLLHWTEHHDETGELPTLAAPTGFGSIPADRAARFLSHNGFSLEQVERASALVWSDATLGHLEALRAHAEGRASDYRIVQWFSPTPPERVAGFAWMKSRMSTDVPEGDLDMPEEIWDDARVRRQDERMAAKGWSMLVTAAEHIGTGELSAFNELSIGPDHSRATHQYDTLVLDEHRGNRLGMLVKTAGLLAWRAQHPLSPHVRTYNAEENRPMLSINEAIGFEPTAYEGAWKKELT